MTSLKNKTKIVCTIGPASSSKKVITEMIRAGMNVARLNFSHGEFESHKNVIKSLREASEALGKEIAILADLPGPKMRVGEIKDDSIELQKDEFITLTTKVLVGDKKKVSVSFERLPFVVKAGDSLFLNDGIIQLIVDKIKDQDVHCRVIVGGILRSRKGLNLPGIDLGMSSFTDRDRQILAFALENGVDAIGQSFVNTAGDIQAVRNAAKELGHHPFIIAKIERASAVNNFEEILEAADGIMVARGDLGVETPFEHMAILQKDLIKKSLLKGKPVITATQMLESMTTHRQPTRAEATDVANAILDGSDCVMLSGESAMGDYPIEAVRTLAKIAAATEPHSTQHNFLETLKKSPPKEPLLMRDLLSLSVETILDWSDTAAVFVPTKSGATARGITRFRLPVWVVAPTPNENVNRQLSFSYGVAPELVASSTENWVDYTRKWIKSRHLSQHQAILVQGPSSSNQNRNHTIELIKLN
ncbi:pyruvate kinase [bacterium F11]|nr:pyruvate kinase [bacterium F11]